MASASLETLSPKRHITTTGGHGSRSVLDPPQIKAFGRKKARLDRIFGLGCPIPVDPTRNEVSSGRHIRKNPLETRCCKPAHWVLPRKQVRYVFSFSQTHPILFKRSKSWATLTCPFPPLTTTAWTFYKDRYPPRSGQKATASSSKWVVGAPEGVFVTGEELGLREGQVTK